MIVAVSALVASMAPAASQNQPGDPRALVRIPFPQDDGSLTPYTFELGYPLVTLIYDTLFWRDRSGNPQPWLAESASLGNGGRSLTVRLVEGARWHDGTPLTAADVEFTYQYLEDRPHPRFSPQLGAIERASATDERTVVFTLKHPAPGFLDQPLSDVPILPAHIWRSLPGDQIAPPGLPVGSGPYRLVEHIEGESYRFEADPSYFRGRPAVSTIAVTIINETEGTFRALERRNVDMIPVSLDKDATGRLEGLGTKVVTGAGYLGTALFFNLRQAPFDRVEVRRAIAKALDLPRIRRLVEEVEAAEHGYLHPASSWSTTERLHTFDEAEARQELAQLGLEPIEILVPDNDPIKKEAGRQVALAIVRAGAQATSKAVPRDDFDRVLGYDGTVPGFSAAIGVIPPLASYDPDYLARLFGSSTRFAPLNQTGFFSPNFDAIAQLVASTPDPAARKVVVLEALKLLASEVPAVPLFFATGAYAYRPAIYDGWVFVKGTGILDKRSFVDPGPVPEGTPTTIAAQPAGPVGDPVAGSGSGGPPLVFIGLGIVAVAIIGGVVALRRR